MFQVCELFRILLVQGMVYVVVHLETACTIADILNSILKV